MTRLVILFTLLPSTAFADLIVTEVRDGRNFSILDTGTGATWITPPHTNSLSAREAMTANPGFQLPTRDQVVELFVNAGLPELEGDKVAVDPAIAAELRQLMSDSVNVVGTYVEGGAVGRIGLYANDLSFQAEPANLTLDTPITFEGHWLIQVPEPATLGLLACGLAMSLCYGLGRRPSPCRACSTRVTRTRCN